jgi:hypothetical protein
MFHGECVVRFEQVTQVYGLTLTPFPLHVSADPPIFDLKAKSKELGVVANPQLS